MKERKFEFLCENISQISEAIEKEFIIEISQLETDVHSIQMGAHKIRNSGPNLSKALSTISNEITQILGKIWEVKELSSMKGTLALLKAWPENHPIVKRVITIIDRVILIEEKARLRVHLKGLLAHSILPIRDETRRYSRSMVDQSHVF